MKYLYIPLGIAATVFVVYMAGARIGGQKCRADIADAAAQKQSEINLIIGEINAETYHTTTDDIRRVLREKYTIAE